MTNSTADVLSQLSAQAQLRRTTIMTNAARFGLGQVVATPRALDVLQNHGFSAAQLLARHVTGDWGDCHPDDAALNEQALKDGSRIFSVYRLVNADVLAKTPRNKRDRCPTIWVITDAANDAGVRAVTTLLRPEDY
ncbi:MAG: type I restriction endonuclease subunit M [Rhodoferax sp.]